MAVKLRLRRMGRKKRPVYSLVATDARSPRDGRFIEDLGRYEPLAEPAKVALKTDRILYWLQEGAQPSGTVRSILSKEGVMLRLHLGRKGKGAEEIDQAVEAHREQAGAKGTTKMTPAERRAAALAEERKKAEAEAKQRAEEEAAREAELQRQKEEEEKAAREPAAAELAAKQSAEEAAGDEGADAATEAASEGGVAEPAADSAEEQPAVEAETSEEAEAESGENVAEQTEAGAEDGTPAESEEKEA